MEKGDRFGNPKDEFETWPKTKQAPGERRLQNQSVTEACETRQRGITG